MNELLSLSRAARRLGVPAWWLRTEAVLGRVPALRAGQRLLFDVDAVRAALLERAKVSLAAPSAEGARDAK